MKTIIALFLALVITTGTTSASDIPPTSRITLDSPARSELIGYTGETLMFSSSTSSANCGTINQRRWRLDSGSYVYATNFTQTFTLPAGVYEKTYTLELRTRNTCNLYDTETLIVTIRRDQRTYFVKDHLGSVRVVVNEAGDPISYDDYFPFGLSMPSYSGNTANPNDNYKFTGHERDDEAGLTIDYMMARNYDPVIGRFLSVDPHHAKYPNLSPYNYAVNNPLKYIDPDGKDAWIIIDYANGTVTIMTTIFIYGDGANSSIANMLETGIMSEWNKGFKFTNEETGQVFDVIFDINVEVFDKKDPNRKPGLFSGRFDPSNADNFIDISNSNQRSFVRVGGDEGEWRASGRNGRSYSADNPGPHEFGHLVGLKDRYNKYDGKPNTGWKGNIMSEPAMQGSVDQRNINAILAPVFQMYNISNKGIRKASSNSTSTYKTKLDVSFPRY